MRKTTLATLAAVTLLSGGMLATQAGAAPLVAATALDVATSDTAHVEQVALVCGYRGCFRVWRPYYGYGYGRYYRHYGYYGRPYAWYGHRHYW